MIADKYNVAYMAARRRLQPGATRGADRTDVLASCSASQVNMLGTRHPSPTRRFACRFSVALLIGLLGAAALTASPALALTEHVFKLNFGGSGTDALSDPTDVAVDNSSGPSADDIYVTDPAKHRIEKFDPSGKFILMFGKDVNETTGGNVCTAASGNTCKVGTEGFSPVNSKPLPSSRSTALPRLAMSTSVTQATAPSEAYLSSLPKVPSLLPGEPTVSSRPSNL